MPLSRVAALGLLLCTALPTFAELTPIAKPPAAGPADPTQLIELLPAELAGVQQSDATGQQLRTSDFAISTATARYNGGTGDHPPAAEVTITDYAAAPGMAARLTVWSKVDLEQDSDAAHQHTLTIAGHPALMSYNKQDKAAQVQVWVGSRFIVRISTTNLPEDQSQKAAESLPYDKLKAVK